MDAETSRQIAELRNEIADVRAKMKGLLGRAGGYVTGQLDLNGWTQYHKQASITTPAADNVRIGVIDKAGDESVVAVFDDGSTIELANQGSGIGPHAMAIHTDEDTWHAGLTGASLHDPKAHALAGSYHTASGLTAGQTIRATGATTFAWQQLLHNDLGGVTANQHHSQQHTITGSDHIASGLTAGHVIRATGASAFAWQQLLHGDLGSVGPDDHHAQQHAITGSDHTASGLAAGHVIRATGATAFAWQQLQHGDLGGVGPSDHHDPVTPGDGIAVTGQQVAVDLASPSSGLSFTGGDLQLDDSVAGAGLAIASKVLSVGAGTGITVNADDVAVNEGYSFTWTASHEFQATMYTSHIIPRATDTYDVGSSTRLVRKGFFSEFDALVFAEQSIVLVGGYLMIPHDSGTIAADVGSADTSVDFGKTMVQNDFVLFRGLGQVEYMQVGTLVSGTRYNVTRNLDGSGANDWPAGEPFAVLGNTDDGRIELDAQTGGPRISIIEQGATYNAQTERVRQGDLAGWQSAGLTGYGFAVGDYAGNEYAYYEPGSGFVVRGTIRADDGYLSTLSVTGTLTLSGSGKLITAASPSPRVEITTTLLAGYSDATTKEFYIDATDGKAYACEGNVRLDSEGISVICTTDYQDTRALRFMSTDGTTIATKFQGYVNANGVFGKIEQPAISGKSSYFEVRTNSPSSDKSSSMSFLAYRTGASVHPRIDLANGTQTYIRIWDCYKVYVDAGLKCDGIYISTGGDVTPTDEQLRLVYSGTWMGQLSCEDTTWFRINQDVAKNIYTPRLFRADGGLAAGAISPGSNNLGYTGTLYAQRGGTNYAGLINTHRYFKQATGDYTIQTSWADTGFSQTITVPSGGYVHVVFTGMTQITSYSSAYDVWLRLIVDGSQEATQVAKTGVRQWDTEGMCLTWGGSVAAGSRVVKVQAKVTGGGTYVLKQDYSQMTIMVYA
jgi:hypothetical protein